MKLNKKQLRKMILQEIRLLKENQFSSIPPDGVNLPWRGDPPYNFILSQKGKNEVHLYKEGDAGNVYYFYSDNDFTFNNKASEFKKCGKKVYQDMFGEQCYAFRAVVPGDSGNVNIYTTKSKQKFSIHGL